jgi:hypothetical protein
VVVLAVLVGGAWSLFGRDEQGPELSPVAFRQEADRICGELAAANAKLEKPFQPYEAEHEAYFKSIHDNVDRARARLDELNPPENMDAPLETIVDRYAAITSKLAQVEAATATDQDPEAKAAISELGPLVEDVVAAERRLGVCEGRSSAQRSILAAAKATRPAPPAEGGDLGI